MKIQSAPDMLNERLRIQDGHFKGATVTLSKEAIVELMENFHGQYGIIFKTEAEAIEWVRLNTAFLIRSKRMKFQYPFVSGHAMKIVTDHLGKELYKLYNP